MPDTKVHELMMCVRVRAYHHNQMKKRWHKLYYCYNGELWPPYAHTNNKNNTWNQDSVYHWTHLLYTTRHYCAGKDKFTRLLFGLPYSIANHCTEGVSFSIVEIFYFSVRKYFFWSKIKNLVISQSASMPFHCCTFLATCFFCNSYLFIFQNIMSSFSSTFCFYSFNLKSSLHTCSDKTFTWIKSLIFIHRKNWKYIAFFYSTTHNSLY